MLDTIQSLKEGNKKWAEATCQQYPTLFDELAITQKPEVLWIGCSDSRVPANQITGSLPGSLFVQRNIANMVVHTDLSLLSVVNYAVKVLKVKHIIVCGHYNCGGVKAAMGNDDLGLLNSWILHIKEVYNAHVDELNQIKDEDKKFDRLVELNVAHQVNQLSKISFIQEEWVNGNTPQIHGWIYQLKDGLIHDLNISINSTGDLATPFLYKK